MIYCPHCGSPNKSSSRFCSNCSSPLMEATQVRCPVCGAANNGDARACEQCGTRLRKSEDLAEPGGIVSGPATPPASRNKDDPPERPNPPAARAPGSTEDMPDWLKRVADLSADRSGNQPASPSAPLAPMPDWLVELGAAESTQAKATGTNPGDVAGNPDWLVASGAQVPSAEEAAEGGAFAGETDAEGSDEESFDAEEEEAIQAGPRTDEPYEIDIPDWIKAMQPGVGSQVDKAGSELQSPEGEAGEIPNWIQRMAPPSLGQTKPAAGPGDEAGAGETGRVPKRLQDLKPRGPALGGERPSEAADADWQAQLRAENQAGMDLARQQNAEFRAEVEASQQAAEADAMTESEPGVGEPASGEQEPADMPDWVHELRPPSGASELSADLPVMDDSERQELPDWLREPIPVTPGWQEPGLVPPEGEAGPVPAWVAELKPSGENRPMGAGALEEVTETSGPLSGVRGVLPVAPAMTVPHSISAGSALPGSGAQIFKSILAGAHTPAATDAARPEHGAANRFIYLLILVAALIPFALGGDNIGMGVITTFNTPALDPTKNFFDQMQALQPGATALVAFDYEPGQSVEMDPIARAIVDDLARRNVNIVAVSTSLTGARIAQNLLTGAAAENPNWVSGINYINVGLLPGDEKGRRALAATWLASSQLDFGGKPLSRSVLGGRLKGWQDVALAIDLAATDDSLRLWMEQVQPNVKTPFVAGVSAGLETLARYYARPKQLVGFLHGLAGAAEYEVMLKQPGMPAHLADAQSFVQLVVLGVILSANVGAFLGFLKKRRSAPAA